MKIFDYLKRGLFWAILALCIIYLLFMSVGFLIYVAIEPNESSIELLKTIFELALWLSVPVLLGLLFLRTKRLIAIGLVFVAIFAFVYIPKIIPRSPEFSPDVPQITVMTFNLKATAEGIAPLIRDIDTDVVALQELSIEGAQAVETLQDIYPYQALHPQQDPNEGQGVISRYPIEADEYWEYDNVPHTLGHQRVEIDFDGNIIVLYNTHPWPPLAWETGYNDESHRVVLQDIVQRTLTENLPLILLGDFNMTDSFKEYDLVATHYTDSFQVAGDGLGYTFPNYKFAPFPRLLRLDYVWHSDHFQSQFVTVLDHNTQSDHSPVVAQLGLVESVTDDTTSEDNDD